MQTKKVKVITFHAIGTKYEILVNKEVQVYNQADNAGDYCITHNSDVYPFLFIPAKLCIDLPIPLKK